MGYRFTKPGSPDFYITLADAGVVRAVATTEGLQDLMPHPEAEGGRLLAAHSAMLGRVLREKATMLALLAQYIEGADDIVRWEH